MVQDQAHGIRQGCIHRRLHRRHLWVWQGTNIGANHTGQHLINRRGFSKAVLCVTDQLLKGTQSPVGGNGIARRGAFRHPHRCSILRRPGRQTAAGMINRDAGLQLVAQADQFGKQGNIFKQLIWMQIVKLFEFNGNAAFVLADGQNQLAGKAFDDLLHRVRVKQNTLSLRQRRASLYLPPGRPT